MFLIALILTSRIPGYLHRTPSSWLECPSARALQPYAWEAWIKDSHFWDISSCVAMNGQQKWIEIGTSSNQVWRLKSVLGRFPSFMLHAQKIYAISIPTNAVFFSIHVSTPSVHKMVSTQLEKNIFCGIGYSPHVINMFQKTSRIFNGYHYITIRNNALLRGNSSKLP